VQHSTSTAICLGISGYEPRDELEANEDLRESLEELRLACGSLMNLGDVREKTVPKMTMVSKPQHGGTINTRSFIPHRCHASIGVLAAVSVATACMMRASPAYDLADIPSGSPKTLDVEHPIGQTSIVAELEGETLSSAAILRTARKLFDGAVFADVTET